MVVGLIILAVIAVGVETNVDRSLIDQSGYLEPSLLGWQLIYILPIAILTNDFFLSGFWMRTFAAKTDKDLWIGTSIATVAVLCILTLVGVGGLLAAWSGAWENTGAGDGYLSFFLLLGQLPAWVVGIVLIMVASLSTAAFDSHQSAMISTASNDLFRNKLNLWVIRGLVVIIIIPIVVVALRSPSILQIFLISDLVSASVVPCLVLGLSEKMYWWRGFDFVVGGLGGIFTVFLFGLVYYDGDATMAGKLILLESGLYANDWSAFGKYCWTLGVSPLTAVQVLLLRLPSVASCGALERARCALVHCSFIRRFRAAGSLLWTAQFRNRGSDPSMRTGTSGRVCSSTTITRRTASFENLGRPWRRCLSRVDGLDCLVKVCPKIGDWRKK